LSTENRLACEGRKAPSTFVILRRGGAPVGFEEAS
jgi:hypothetical protein